MLDLLVTNWRFDRTVSVYNESVFFEQGVAFFGFPCVVIQLIETILHNIPVSLHFSSASLSDCGPGQFLFWLVAFCVLVKSSSDLAVP